MQTPFFKNLLLNIAVVGVFKRFEFEILGIYLLFDPLRCQALLTLPRGPCETQQSWYATARLGVYITTVVLWGTGASKDGSPIIQFFVSRCKEKGAIALPFRRLHHKI